MYTIESVKLLNSFRKKTCFKACFLYNVKVENIILGTVKKLHNHLLTKSGL